MSNTPFGNDLLSRKEFAERLLSFLQTEHQFVDGALVVTLQAPFGSGKTYFLQNWKNALQVERTKDNEHPRPILLNAWESDYCGDPLLALISEISKNLENDISDNDKPNVSALREGLKDFGNFGLALLTLWLASQTGIDVLAAKQYAESEKEKREVPENKDTDILETFEKKQTALAKVKAALKELFKGDEVKAIVMIDELDRCRPDYAISYLETIKHIFDIHGLVFVLAVDHAQLQSTAKALFGSELNFDEYLRKFVQRKITLPEINWGQTNKIVSHYFNKYIKNGKRSSVFPDEHLENIGDILLSISPNFRQIQEIFRIIGHAFSIKEEEGRKGLTCWYVGTILMSILSVMHPSFFQKIGKKELSLHEACNELSKRLESLDKDKQEWWLQIFIFGYPTQNGSDNRHLIFDELTFFSILDKSTDFDTNWMNAFAHIRSGWGVVLNENSGLASIYRKIEGLKTYFS